MRIRQNGVEKRSRGFRGPTRNLRMPGRQGRYKPNPFLQLVLTALDELIEAQSGLLAEYYLPVWNFNIHMDISSECTMQAKKPGEDPPTRDFFGFGLF